MIKLNPRIYSVWSQPGQIKNPVPRLSESDHDLSLAAVHTATAVVFPAFFIVSAKSSVQTIIMRTSRIFSSGNSHAFLFR